MKRPARRVMLADVGRRVVKLSPAPNGSGLSLTEVRALATAAALDPVIAGRAVLLPLAALPDLEAYCELLGVVVKRVGRQTAGLAEVRQ